MTDRPFNGDFDLLPIRSHLDHGPVPRSASMVDFDDAMTLAINADPWTIEGAARIWRGEAIRWRRGNPDIPIDIKAVGALCATRLREKQEEDLNPGALREILREGHRALRRELGVRGMTPTQTSLVCQARACGGGPWLADLHGVDLDHATGEGAGGVEGL